jgi:hypothetical protein
MVSRSDPTKGKAPFKKRALRPWNPALLDSAAPTQPETKSPAEFSSEFLHKQIETTLNIKIHQKSELEKKLSIIDDNRITIGGFFHPKHALFLEPEAVHEAAAIINELRKKEQEIVDIANQLKLTQAEELASRANARRQAEEAARLIAEEQAISAIRQAHQATAQLKFAEERAYLAEQAKIKLEQQQQNNERTLEENLSSSSDRAAVLEKANACEIELRKKLDEERRHIESSMLSLRKQLTDTRKELNEARQSLQQAQTETDLLFFEKNQADLKHSAAAQQWGQTITVYEEKISGNLEHIKKINEILANERNLRKLYEQQSKESATPLFTLELPILEEPLKMDSVC